MTESFLTTSPSTEYIIDACSVLQSSSIMGNVGVTASKFQSQLINICASDIPHKVSICDACKKDFSKDSTLLICGKDRQLCFDCIYTKVTEPKLTSVGQCMICLIDNKDVFFWKRDGQPMMMCLDCVFDNTLFNKASTSFPTHKFLTTDDESNESN